MMARLRLVPFAACLSMAPAGAAAVQSPAPVGAEQSPSAAENLPYPTIEYPQIRLFAAAIELSGQVAQATDPFWLPGVEFLREANPGHRAQVDALAARLRGERDGLYVASAVFTVDRALPRMLVPAIAAAETKMLAANRREYSLSRQVDNKAQSARADDLRRQLQRARPMIERRVTQLAAQAKTPAGTAWLRGLAGGNYRCLGAFHVRATNQAFADKLEAEHCARAWMPAYDPLVATADGRAFAELSGALYIAAIAAMQMSFDAGLRLDSFLPRTEIERAELNYPAGPVGSDELTQRYARLVRP